MLKHTRRRINEHAPFFVAKAFNWSIVKSKVGTVDNNNNDDNDNKEGRSLENV